MNHDGSLPPGVKVVPFYDRGSLIAVTTHTVLHNLIFGCLLVFLIQWIFLGDLRSAIIVGIEHPVCAVLCHHSAGAAGRKRQPAFGRRRGFRHHRGFGGDPGGEYLPEFPKAPEERQGLLQRLAEGFWGPDPTRVAADHAEPVHGWTDRLRLILISAMQVDKAVLFLGADHRGRVRAAVHHAGSRGADLRPDGAHLRLRAGGGVDRHVHRHAGAGVLAAARST